MEDGVEFLHESKALTDDNTDAESILSFNLFLDNNIIRVTYHRKGICSARYLYTNVQRQRELITHGQLSEDDIDIQDLEILSRVQVMIERYMSMNPDFLEDAVV
jgi:hypothetical protein